MTSFFILVLFIWACARALTSGRFWTSDWPAWKKGFAYREMRGPKHRANQINKTGIRKGKCRFRRIKKNTVGELIILVRKSLKKYQISVFWIYGKIVYQIINGCIETRSILHQRDNYWLMWTKVAYLFHVRKYLYLQFVTFKASLWQKFV